jgi:Protein of unknown function (DUF2934)
MKKPPRSNPGQLFMDQNRENRIRERAYEIWTANGRLDGQADHHWLAAEREILAMVAPLPAPKKRAPTPKKRPARSKTTKPKLALVS